MGQDFNFVSVLDDVINNPMESTAQVTSDLATEGNAIAGFLIFAFILLLMVIVLAVTFGGIMAIMKPK